MQHISIQDFESVLAQEQGNPEIDFINVCTPAEYAANHIPGVRSVPLSDIPRHLNEFEDKKTVYVHCRSGARSQMAIEELRGFGVTAELINVTGGILAWDEHQSTK